MYFSQMAEIPLLKREEGRYALATMCIGGGMGIATILASMDS